MNIVFYVGIILIALILYVCLSSTFKYIGLIANFIYNRFKKNIFGDEDE